MMFISSLNTTLLFLLLPTLLSAFHRNQNTEDASSTTSIINTGGRRVLMHVIDTENNAAEQNIGSTSLRIRRALTEEFGTAYHVGGWSGSSSSSTNAASSGTSGNGKGEMGKGSSGKGTGSGKGSGIYSNGDVGKVYGKSKISSGSLQIPSSPCIMIPIFMHIKDLESHLQTDELGNGFDIVPFYHNETMEHLGYYSDEAVSLHSGDCVGNGRFAFDKYRKFSNQISVQFTCYGKFNSITGGTGDYGCSKGYEQYIYGDNVILSSQLHICSELCPHNAERTSVRL